MMEVIKIKKNKATSRTRGGYMTCAARKYRCGSYVYSITQLDGTPSNLVCLMDNSKTCSGYIIVPSNSLDNEIFYSDVEARKSLRQGTSTDLMHVCCIGDEENLIIDGYDVSAALRNGTLKDQAYYIRSPYDFDVYLELPWTKQDGYVIMLNPGRFFAAPAASVARWYRRKATEGFTRYVVESFVNNALFK